MNQNLPKLVPSVHEKFNEFHVNLVNMVYEYEEKEEEKNSVYSSAMINPSQVNVRFGGSSIPNSARIEKVSPPLVGTNLSLINENGSMTVHRSVHSPPNHLQGQLKKNPLLPPSPNSRDPLFVLKGKIRSLVHHTEQLYQKMVLEKNKTDKK